MFFKPTGNPLPGIALSFSAGIILQLCIDIHTIFTWIPCFVILISGLLLLRSSDHGNGVRCLILLISCITGIGNAFVKQDLLREGHFGRTEEAFREWEGIVESEPQTSFGRTRFVVEITGMIRDDGLLPSCGRLLCYVEPSIQSISPGELIRFSGTARRILGPIHPDDFDKEAYYRSKDVYYECYARSAEVIRGSGVSAGAQALRRIAFGWKQRILQIFRERLTDQTTYEVIAALTCGYKEELDESTRNIFSRSGVIHVLCVSGLHTGLVFSLFLLIIRTILLFGRTPGLAWLVLLVPVWLYAMMTGLSDSVVRAAMMISMYNFGKFGRCDISPMNIVAGSAIILLSYSPHQVLGLGFQLSYLAVTGIVLLHPHISKCFRIRGKVGRWISDAASVSVSAQVTTAPLSMFTFKMLPLYFLPANLIAIPIATLLVYLSFLFLPLSGIPMISDLLVVAITTLVRLMVGLLELIESLPGGILEFNHVNWWIPVSLYLILLCSFMMRSRDIHSRIRYNISVIAFAVMVNWIGTHIFRDNDSLYIMTKKKELVLRYRNETRIIAEECRIIVEYPDHTYSVMIRTNNAGKSLLEASKIVMSLYRSNRVRSDPEKFRPDPVETRSTLLSPYSSVLLRFKVR